MKTKKIEPLPFHYGWLIALVGLLAVFTALGLGRFALGMMLPSMGATLNLSYAEMGFISTGNFIGYLAAVVLSHYGVTRYGSRKFISGALLVLGVSMILVGRAAGFEQVLFFYCLTGLASGAVNVPIMGMATAWFSASQRGKAAGIMAGGSGLGLMFGGALIPWVNSRIATEGWRTSWLVFGIIAVMIALVCLIVLRNRPQDVGLNPVGSGEDSSWVCGSENTATENTNPWVMLQLSSTYFLFGFTYAVYVTFIVTTLVQERGFSEAMAGDIWVLVGFLSLFSGLLFGTLSDRLGRKACLMLVFALQGLAYVFVAGAFPPIFVYLSVGLFGICAWSIPSIMAAAVGDYMGPQRAVTAFGAITFFFGIGQIAGPGLAGVLAEQSGHFTSSYWMAALLAGSAILIAATLRRPSV